jgi:hypothetical protein
MAQRDQELPKWLKRAVKAQVISLPKAYLLLWNQQQAVGWTPLPEELHPEARRIWLLELPPEGRA